MEPLGTAWVLVTAAAVLLAAALSTRLAGRSGIPSLLLFLALGMLVRAQPVLPFPHAHPVLAFRVGTAALVLILFDGGLNTPLAAARSVALPAGILATFGVLATAGIAALFAMWVGVPPGLAVLLGSVSSSTDAAAVFAALRASHARLREKVGLTLELESGLNDPMAMFLTILTTEAVLADEAPGLATLALLVWQGAGGVLVGFGVGYGGRRLLARAGLRAAGLYPIVTTGLALGAFGVATLADTSGFLAVYVAALVLGGGTIPYRSGVRQVHDAVAWVSQITVFFVLGLSVDPHGLVPALLPGALLTLVLGLVARPVAVILSLLALRFTWPERLFISLAGLRGATPIVLATYPLLRGVPGAEQLFALVFALVVVSSFVPGMLVAPAAARLGLQQERPPPAPAGLEIVSRGEYDGEFVSYFVSAASAVAGATLRDLPLPDEVLVTLILRGHDVVVPRGETQFQPGDYVYVFARKGDRPLADLLFGQSAG